MRFIVRIGLFVAGISLLLTSVSITFARREALQPQLAATVIVTHLRQTQPHYDIFLVHAESGLRRRIAYGSGIPDYLHWTADGQWLSFYEGTTYGTGRFLRVDWRADELTTIASDGAWFSRQGPPSPDSRWQVWIGLNRTLYLYNPTQGTTALIDEFGEHPQGIRSSQRVAWSADSRWLYVIDIWRYVGDRILGPDTNIIDLDYFVYRIDLENEIGELLVSERAAFLQALDIGTQWIVYVNGSLNSRSVWRVGADGSDRVPVTFTTNQDVDFPLFWATPTGDVIVVESHLISGVRRYVFKHIVTDGRVEELLSIGGVSTFQSLQNLNWSADHQFLSFIGETITNERRLFIVDEAGLLQYSIPVELCLETAPMFHTFWQQHDLYILEHADGSCRLRKISATHGTSAIQFDLPKEAQLISIVNDVTPPVVKVEDGQSTTLISLDGTQTIHLTDALNNADVTVWSWMPIRSQSHRWTMFISIAFMSAAVLDVRLKKRQSP